MIRFLLSNPLARWLGGVLTALLALWGYGAAKRREGRQAAQNEGLQDAQERVEKGREAVRDGRELDPDERVRRNDGRW